MAEALPFRAVRPAPDKAPYVISRSYESYGKQQREYELENNPFSFLHILNPGFKFHKKLQGSARFTGVRNRYLEFLDEGILVRDEKPGYYLYERSGAGYAAHGIFCATSTADYRNGKIRKHEDTLHRREVLFADYLEAVRFNAEPVLMTYPHNEAIARLLAERMKQPADYFFTSPDRITHRMWVIHKPEAIAKISRIFGEMPALYIADGHHRSASSELLSERLESKNQESQAHRYFMSYLIDESQLRIRAFSRLLTDLNQLSPEDILFKLDQHYRIHEQGELVYEPKRKHTFGMYLAGKFYALHLRETAYSFGNPLRELDSHILYETILKPIFGIDDLRNDQRIRYVSDPHPGPGIKSAVDSGDYAIGFSMLPIGFPEIKHIADAELTMPPKSTFVEPKLPSGLTIYDI